jgi:C-terminal processing protease CtpA/Prc
VLLINRDTFSAGETFTLVMRVLPRVTIVGESTVGVFSDTADALLPNGWQFIYSIGVWRDAQGHLWEGQGVPPDNAVTASAADLASGRDRAPNWAIASLAGGVSQSCAIPCDLASRPSMVPIHVRVVSFDQPTVRARQMAET